jgi:hypothetical protein
MPPEDIIAVVLFMTVMVVCCAALGKAAYWRHNMQKLLETRIRQKESKLRCLVDDKVHMNEAWAIQRHDLVHLDKIGAGASGLLYNGVWG